ncbi:MAG: hypothetical protein CVT99_01980 [Bacteroidetes bacterium HGW-Bacteroidetes-16]|jgi:cellulose synthase/poly-beta-1,6-N-acetylglucosamine synthase-like glycosyltransferase|nr:MAG: hypothetical protein CVT99_01980 [Bacteroidetes bacterium HGW-Bacteroidetes-16]
MWIELLSVVVLVISMAYLLVMIIITIGWFSLDKSVPPPGNTQKKVTVLVAARNEEHTIVNLLKSLEQQHYPKALFKVVIVDDHSTDQTFEVITNFAQIHAGLNIKVIKAIGHGKKAALKQGISLTKTALIVTTDADCIVPPGWLQNYADAFDNEEVSLILAPVVYQQKRRILQKLMTLEFFSLVASGAGAAGIRLPFMGNGANMAFTSQVYESGVDDKGYHRYTSGDDVFLIHHTFRYFGRKSIRFLLKKEVLVETPPPESLSQFINQRLRWASKAKGYQSPVAIVVSFVVLLTNSMLAVLFFSGFWMNWLWWIYTLLMLMKILIDMPLVYGYAGFAQRNDLKKWFIPFSFIYPFYVVLVGLASLVVSISWKDRRFSR